MSGININTLRPEHLAYVSRVRPPVNFLKDPKYESAAEIKSASPESKLIGRPYIPDGEVHNWFLSAGTAEGARAAGKRAAEYCLNQGVPQVDAWQLLNEPPVGEIWQIQLLAEFDASFARAMSKGGSKACVGAFSRGTPQIPREDGGAALSAYSPALRVAYDVGAWLTFHAYGKYPLYHDAEYLALRWQRHILPWYRAQGVPIPRYAITECGVDLGTGIDAENNDGWRKTPYNDDIPAYGRDLLMLMREYAKDPSCIGATAFCAGHAGWESFVVDGPLLDHLATISWPKFGTAIPSPSPTPTPKPETPMPDRLVTILQAKLGQRFEDVRADMPDGPGAPFGYADSTKMPYICLHYSASSAGPTTPLGIARFHTDKRPAGRGWAGIGYHFVIDEGKAFYVGDVNTQRAHVENRNDEALGICFTGTYETILPAPSDINAARMLIAGLDEFFGHQKKLIGHKQMLPGHTLCPGRIVELISELRQAPLPPKPVVPDYGKVTWAVEQAARILQEEGLQREHDYLVDTVLPPIIKLRDGK